MVVPLVASCISKNVALQDKRPTYKPEDNDTGLLVYEKNIELNQGAMIIQDTPDKWVAIEKSSIRFEIPYSSNWGTKKYKIAPFHERKDGLVFGPLQACEGGGLCRQHFIKFIDNNETSLDAILMTKKEDGKNYGYNVSIEITNIGDKKIHKLIEEGLCTEVSYFVSIEEHLFTLSSCEDKFSNEFFPEIIKRVIQGNANNSN